MYSAGIKAKKATIAVLAVILAVMLGTTFISSAVSAYGATVDYYEVKIGNSTFATVATEAEAKEIIEGAKEYFLRDVEDAQNVAVDPVMTINPRTFRIKTDTLPEVATDPEEVIDELVAGRTLVSEYTIQTGDTMEQVTGMLGCTEAEVIEQNEQVTADNLEPGVQVRYEKVVPYIEVSLDQFVEREEEIPFNTVYEETEELLVGEEQVKQEGTNGLKKVTDKQCLVNGEVVSTEVFAEEVVTEPVDKIILKGTKEPEPEPEPETETATTTTNNGGGSNGGSNGGSSGGSSGGGSTEPPAGADAQAVINYALQFVGNPYVWGGTSLTNGCDCSGFIYRVFQDCGYYGVPRVGVEYVYPRVSASELRPGDVTVYGTHYALYIGNGMEVSAVNEAQGIRVHPMYYSNSAFVCGVRIIP